MQKEIVKNHCTMGMQRMCVRWGSNWGKGEPPGEKEVQVVMQRTEGWRKWEEKGQSESKSKGQQLWVSAAQCHVPRDGS